MFKYILMLALFTGTVEASTFVSCKNAKTDLKALQCVVYHEARGATKTDKVATAFVAKNRSEHSSFPDNLVEVIYTKHQFSWTTMSTSALVPKNQKAWKESMRIAALVLEGEVSDPTNGQVYFGTKRKGYMKRVTLVTGAHYYGK